MSGHCDFCNVWHSGSCCHPGRSELTELRRQLAEACDLLGEISSWVDNWSPTFASDDEWLPVASRVASFIATNRAAIAAGEGES